MKKERQNDLPTLVGYFEPRGVKGGKPFATYLSPEHHDRTQGADPRRTVVPIYNRRNGQGK